MADDLFELLHGLGAGQSLGVYGRARAAAHRLHRVHVPRVADGVFVLDAPALGLSLLTVVFVFFYLLVAVGRVDSVLQNGFFRPTLKLRVQRIERAKK